MQFVALPSSRARYWARNFAGWFEFSSVRANDAHHALARLQRNGWLGGGLITQNVDRLHHQAGARDIVELHGTTHECVPLTGLRTRTHIEQLHVHDFS